ncbi:Histidine-containing phosphotransfer protein 1 [Vitis vinifera]|uniref:Histidine-containing phosphotransfer protein n=1 Tax=Vitis vinifera TaxID=29760 RepID=A0A438CXQ5_VITVI|nr:Histidine-containing phosphotransfer protein 1 [Vitis vinifera]
MRFSVGRAFWEKVREEDRISRGKFLLSWEKLCNQVLETEQSLFELELFGHLGWDVPKKTPCIPLFTQTKTLGCLCCHVAHTPRPSHLPLASSFLDLLEFSDGHGGNMGKRHIWSAGSRGMGERKIAAGREERRAQIQRKCREEAQAQAKAKAWRWFRCREGLWSMQHPYFMRGSWMDSEKLLNDLPIALDQQNVDFKRVDSHVHQLKGSSSSIGPQRVKNVCIAFRNYCEEQNTDACLSCLQQVKQEYSLIKSTLETLFRRCSNLIVRNTWWWSSIESLKMGHPNRGVVCSVVPKFSPWKKSTPFSRLLRNKTVKILLNAPVNYLRLTVDLGMIGRAHVQLSTQHFEEFTPKVTYENGISVTNN